MAVQLYNHDSSRQLNTGLSSAAAEHQVRRRAALKCLFDCESFVKMSRPATQRLSGKGEAVHFSMTCNRVRARRIVKAEVFSPLC